MLSSVFGKKSRVEDLKTYTQESNKKYVNMGMQAALLTSAALTAEVNALKENLERSESELGRAKKQLEDKDLVAREITRITWVLQGPRTRWRP